jgi:anti-sigma factor RsiW
MNCGAVRENLSLAAEGELPAEELLVIRAHLAECEACGAAYRELLRLVEDLRSLPRPRPPVGLRPRIGLALDAVEEAEATEKTAVRSLWEVAGPYLAAAAVIAIAFALATLVSRPRLRGQVARVPNGMTNPVESAKDVLTVEAPPGVTGPPAGKAGSPDAQSDAAVAEANRRIRDAQDKAAMQGRDAKQPWPPELGTGRSPGVGPGQLTEPPGTPANTFSTKTGGEEAIPAPRVPTQIEVNFRPPSDPVVGTSASGTVELTAQDGIPKVVVTASGDEGLTIDKPGGEVYNGPLRPGEIVRVPVPMTASQPGLHELRIDVQSNAPGGNTNVKAFIPNFRPAGAPARAPAPTSPADKPVSLVFKNAPVRQALLDIARQAGLRIEMAEDLGRERINQDVRGVPARAALRAVAEEGGCQVEEEGGVFKITRGTSGGG